ncbi:MAG: 23S rRNA (pseudouridine(1915)-N(3))-methyltransferase RlmH [Caulobacterales bacterium]|nr:23S rRNA (pseudouridine(1915)-N(3))-methyltransferase RlmH [Caulobacterales bacterium]
MRLTVRAIGRVRTGPERALIDEYRRRAEGLGRRAALAPVEEIELEPKKPGAGPEAAALLADLPAEAAVVALDERGRALSSAAFASQLGAWRDQGRRSAIFLIGGADGLADAARSRADLILAFGPQTWPHRLARVLLFEQLYRAIAILSGTPYHRA